MMKHFIYRCEVAESYWCVDAKGFYTSGTQVSVWGANVCSLSTFLNLAVNDEFILPRAQVDKVIEDYRLKNDDKTDTWLLAV